MEKSRETYIYGRNPVLEAIESGRDIDKIFLSNSIRGEFEKNLRKLSKSKNYSLKYVPNAKLDKMIKGNHQGVIAYCSIVRYQQLDDLLPLIFEQGKQPLILILEGVTDVRNFGAIVRSAEVFGVHAIVIPEKNSARINNDALKSSSGALLKMPICKVKSLTKTIEHLKHYGLKVYCTSLATDQFIQQINFNEPLAVVLGSEGEGVSQKVMELSDQLFKIPQLGEIDSLNVSVATGVILYEILKQRSSNV